MAERRLGCYLVVRWLSAPAGGERGSSEGQTIQQTDVEEGKIPMLMRGQPKCGVCMVFDQATNLSQAEVLSHQEQLPCFVVLEIELLGARYRCAIMLIRVLKRLTAVSLVEP